ncbi:hypothetical protein ElyMa_000593200 [Elysia marginata]|uniref:Uncharacterized protein n=1 Tax=Elysia marginata TaxID=1093978 RepID=A0AAV4G5K8_9GAST|nr:hypothetical protein ElyMa_000593200 [Elysia marginata]
MTEKPIHAVDSPLSDNSAESIPHANWNLAMAEIFSTPSLQPRNKPSSRGGRAITSHRLLISEDILEAKRAKEDEKERKENEKGMRQERKSAQPKRSKK